MKKLFINYLFIFISLNSCSGSKGEKSNNLSELPQPNFIIFIADDVSIDDFGCYGHPVIKTPNIDKLALHGLQFTNTFLTTSSCSPSRASIITGRYPHNTGACELHSPIPDNQVFFPELLQNAGYYTAQAGKWHFGSSGAIPEGTALSAFDRTGGSKQDGGGDSGAEKWVQFMKERPGDKPFFMWFAAHDAHRAWDDNYEISYNIDDIIVPEYMEDNEKTRKDLAAYYSEVSRFDHYVGEVMSLLEDQGLLKNTFILVMADNGRPFPRDKTRLYDSGIKTPFVIHYPALLNKEQQTSSSMISVIDIAPTICELAGAEISEKFQGKSFLPVLLQPEKKFRNYVFAEHNWHDFKAHERMVRTERFLYIENNLWQYSNAGAVDVLNGGAGQTLLGYEKSGKLTDLQSEIFEIPQPQVEFYNCIDDPKQFHNLINEKSVQKEIGKLRDILLKWKEETQDSQPEILTPDWYDRWTLERSPEFGVRGIIPGTDNNATITTKGGPF